MSTHLHFRYKWLQMIRCAHNSSPPSSMRSGEKFRRAHTRARGSQNNDRNQLLPAGLRCRLKCMTPPSRHPCTHFSAPRLCSTDANNKVDTIECVSARATFVAINVRDMANALFSPIIQSTHNEIVPIGMAQLRSASHRSIQYVRPHVWFV